MLLWRAALERLVLVDVDVVLVYRRTMIRGVFGVVKGGFSRVRISPVIPTTPPPTSFPQRTLALPSTPPRFPPTRE